MQQWFVWCHFWKLLGDLLWVRKNMTKGFQILFLTFLFKKILLWILMDICLKNHFTANQSIKKTEDFLIFGK